MQRHLHYVGVPERPRPERELLFRLGLLFRRHPEGLSSSEASLLPPGQLCCHTRAMETTDMETATIKTPKSYSYMSSFTISARSQLSGHDAQHDLAALVRRTSEHLVGRRASSSGSTVPRSVTSFHLSNSSVILFSRAVVTST